ncbi:TPA: hypothetical protein NGW16_004220 [Vibrio parahaemolyticus]|nr:hypothetical protein [Vibrio cholerae]HCE4999484.1 hypothetical protein [Vibrio parahaemolyticus]
MSKRNNIKKISDIEQLPFCLEIKNIENEKIEHMHGICKIEFMRVKDSIHDLEFLISRYQALDGNEYTEINSDDFKPIDLDNSMRNRLNYTDEEVASFENMNYQTDKYLDKIINSDEVKQMFNHLFNSDNSQINFDFYTNTIPFEMPITNDYKLFKMNYTDSKLNSDIFYIHQDTGLVVNDKFEDISDLKVNGIELSNIVFSEFEKSQSLKINQTQIKSLIDKHNNQPTDKLKRKINLNKKWNN